MTCNEMAEKVQEAVAALFAGGTLESSAESSGIGPKKPTVADGVVRGLSMTQAGILFGQSFLFVMCVSLLASSLILFIQKYVMPKLSMDKRCALSPNSAACMSARKKQTVFQAVLSFFQVVIIFVASVVAVSAVGFSKTIIGIVTGVLSATVGLAMHPFLQDYISGAMRLAGNEFSLNDWVDIHCKDMPMVSGTVFDVQLRRIVLKKIDGSLAYINCSHISGIHNYNQTIPNLRVTFPISTSASLQEVMNAGRYMCTQLTMSPETAPNFLGVPHVLGINASGPHSYELTIEAKCKRGTQFSMRRKLLEQGVATLQEFGIEHSMSHVTLAGPEGTAHGKGSVLGSALP